MFFISTIITIEFSLYLIRTKLSTLFKFYSFNYFNTSSQTQQLWSHYFHISIYIYFDILALFIQFHQSHQIQI
jgi:hypothetical protein